MSEFASKKREFLLEYGTYEFMFDELVDGFAVVLMKASPDNALGSAGFEVA